MVFDLETDTLKTLSVLQFRFSHFGSSFFCGVWAYFVTWIGILLILICFMFKVTRNQQLKLPKTKMVWNKCCFGLLEGLQQGLACMEAKFCLGKLKKVKNYYLRVLSFEFRLKICLAADGNLTLISRIRNINCKPFSFSIAFHTYFSISDISEVRVEGLEVLDYLDNLHDKQRFTEQGDALTFESEIDRVYLSSSDLIAVLDHERKRTFVVRREGLPDVVVWNPWEKKAKSIVDLGDEDYKQMLCVDGAAIEKPITLKPGEEWTGRLELSVIPSS
ncbi:putative glucose-6-phosphate 1-epimerase isoform X5 [Benincasa hispida]|uniref:putative glucose-6-phosphate 1-epimerase isoform X5 n=1 Tax=Benincasa hispida TaxID=102211 RepID=UPI0019002B7E|nr:putative glucose-6-phosphate 1-epimerase isoform X5 [Benincasa hispida]